MPGDASTRGFFTYGGIETLNPGVRAVQGRTIPNRFNGRYGSARIPSDAAAAQGGNMRTMNSAPMNDEETEAGGNPLLVWLLGAGLLIGLHFLLQRTVGDGPNILGVNIVNVLLVSLMAILGISAWKIVFTRFQVPGLTPLVQGV